MSGATTSGIKQIQILCAVLAGLAAPACTPASDEPASRETTQALASSCGTKQSVCLAHVACESWDQVMIGDGLGYTTTSWSEPGGGFRINCDYYPNSYCDDWDTFDTCAPAITPRRDALIATRPHISQPALDGFTVTVDEINVETDTYGCGPYDQYCSEAYVYVCNRNINNYPTPITAVRDWCDCAEYGPETCEPNNVVVAGGIHTCAVLSSGVQCWGGNDRGQLGNNSTIPSFQRVAAVGLSTGMYTASAGSSHSCAISQGVLKCWGRNDRGQLGNGPAGNDSTTLTDSHVPVNVTVSWDGAQAVSTGGLHSCAVVNNAARCWGA